MSEHQTKLAQPAPGAGTMPRPEGIAALLHPALDPLFRAPADLEDGQSWLPHLPFLAWLVSEARPGTVVTLGAANGAAHLACCEAVAAAGLPTRCVLVAGEPLAAPLRHALDRQHAASSRLVSSSIGQTAAAFAPGGIDLLFLDADDSDDAGMASASAWNGWAGTLSPRAVVLVKGPDEDVRGNTLWSHLHRSHPAFLFRHGVGLGVVAAGPQIPDGLQALFALADDSPAASRLRARMALLGDRWRADRQGRTDERALQEQADSTRAALADADQTLRTLRLAHDRLRDELAHAKADRFRLERDAARALALSLARQQAETLDRARDRQAAERSTDRSAALLLAGLRDTLARSRDADRAAMADLAGRSRAERTEATRVSADARATETLLRDALARAEQAIGQRDAALRMLVNSASWRVMRPLRGLRTILHRSAPFSLPTPFPSAALTIAPPPRQETAEPPTGLPLPLIDGPATGETAGEAAGRAAWEAIGEASGPTSDIPAPPDALDRPLASDPAPPAASGETPSDAPSDAPGHATVADWRPIRRILFVAGEPGTPGATYRTARNAAACRAAGYQVDCVDIAGVDPDNLAAADLVVLWRAGFSGHVQTMLDLAAHARTRVAFDIDDLIVQPSLAVAEIIDGIRTTFVTEAEGRAYFQSMQRTLLNCDLCTTTTAELAAAAGRQHPMVNVLPNSFDQSVERASRRAVRLRGERSRDGLVRLGYAGGTRTHQKDFASIAPSLASVLRARNEVLLVLFRDPRSGEGLVLLEEFPELVPFADRIEWRDLVPLADLPDEMARFDISLCPLEMDNPFCEAKSELKYFESALAGVCLVATPTGPFRRAVRNGVTGFLPADAAGWTGTLLRLVDEPDLRRGVARAALHDVLWRFGPRRQAERWALLLAELDGGAAGARAADLALRRRDDPATDLPEVPDGEVLFSHDRLGEALVTVGMTSFNYETFIGEALESVVAQTLEDIDLVVVDDGSRDGSVSLLLDWAERNRMRFNRLRILRTTVNAGLGGARNLVFDQAETPWIMVLDSDNRLAPEACEALLRAVDTDRLAAFAYPRIRQFGGADTVMGGDDFQPGRLASGNYIDAMALVAKWAWAAAGGYYVRRDAMGWEDFSLWCRLVERGLHGVAVGEELAFYRVHARSMVNAITEQSDNKRAMVSFVEARHPWLRLRMRAVRKRLDRPATP